MIFANNILFIAKTNEEVVEHLEYIRPTFIYTIYTTFSSGRNK